MTAKALHARVAAWVVAAGSVAILAGAAACAGPVISQGTGALTVAHATASATPSATSTATPSATNSPAASTTKSLAAKTPCPALPHGGLKLNPRFPLPRIPHGAKVTHPAAELGCAYLAGYANVRKLNGASLVGPGLANLAIGVQVVYNLGTGYFAEETAAELDYKPCRTCQIVHGLPPARATFLAFGFMPVSATLQLTEIGTINIVGVGTTSALASNTAWSLMELRVYDVDINGQPLDVGPHCQTTRAVLVKLTGRSTGSQPYSLQGGGPLTGEITIPPFGGCGVTENLDPLFTGTVSGPANYAIFTQGAICTLIGDLGCPPPVPKPVR